MSNNIESYKKVQELTDQLNTACNNCYQELYEELKKKGIKEVSSYLSYNFDDTYSQSYITEVFPKIMETTCTADNEESQELGFDFLDLNIKTIILDKFLEALRAK